MKRVVAVVVLISILSSSYSQNIDSLRRVAQQATSDTAKVRLYLEISEVVGDNESIEKYAKLALELTESILSKEPSESVKFLCLQSKALAINNLGYALYAKGKIIEAFAKYHESIRILEDIGDTKILPVTLNNAANVYFDYNDFDRCIEFSSKALKVIDQKSDKIPLGVALFNIAISYENKKNYSNAEEFYKKALPVIRGSKNLDRAALILSNLAHVYYKMGRIDSAVIFYNSTLSLVDSITDITIIAGAKNGLADIYQDQENYSKAIVYYSEALKILETGKDKIGQATLLRNVADMYVMQNKLGEARKYAEKALVCAKESGSLVNIRDEAEMLCEIYKRQSDKRASEVCVLFTQMIDSVKNYDLKKAEALAKFRADYKTYEDKITTGEEKSAEMTEDIKEDSNILIYLGIGFVILIIVVFFWIRRK